MNELENKEIETSPQTQMIVGRMAQEVQAAMIVAKKFPRDEVTSEIRILNACKRKSLAEQAEYTFPKGNTKVTGASIRLAETLALSWGNIDSGIIELEQKDGKSDMMAYSWDLETNTRITKVFSVEHVRVTKKGSYALTDPRDIYELTANQGARRLRACILAVIPGDIVENALQQCRDTLKGSYKEPFEDRIKKMLLAFKKDHKVDKEMIEKFIGYTTNRFDENDILKLKGVYKALKDNMSKREDYFEMEKPVATDVLSKQENALNEKEPEKQEDMFEDGDFSGTPFAEVDDDDVE